MNTQPINQIDNIKTKNRFKSVIDFIEGDFTVYSYDVEEKKTLRYYIDEFKQTPIPSNVILELQRIKRYETFPLTIHVVNRKKTDEWFVCL